MGRQNVERLAFNRGVVSPLALARTDVKRITLSAEEQTNWMPRVLGPMSLRPGLQFIGGTHNHQAARYLPFVFSVTDTALLELTPNLMRVLVDDGEITRSALATSVIANGTFTSNLTSWTDSDEGGFAVSAWLTGGYMSLLGDGTLAAVRDQAVALSGSGEHALRVVVTQGVLLLRIGSSAGDDDYISETSLGVGTHSLTFTPLGTFHIRLFNRDDYPTLVDSCVIDASGELTLPTPWGASDLDNIRYVQSGDIIFVACAGIRQMKIERRSTTSWSVVTYAANDGPFLVENLTSITMTSSTISGTTTLTASKAYFKSSNVGSLFKLTSEDGHIRDKILGAANVFSDEIRVSGLTVDRNLHIITTGTWVATLTLQRSVGAPGTWTDITTYTTNQDADYNDGFDNQIIYYRLGIKTGQYTSGTAAITLSYPYGYVAGIAKITAVASSTSATAVVLRDMGSVGATSTWAEGAWSDRRGFPSAVVIHEGRMWWAGKDKQWGSVSDAYYNFGDDQLGDAGTISRSIGIGPVDVINWLISTEGLVMGGQGGEFTCRSSSLGEPLTPTNFNIKRGTTVGSAPVDPVAVDAGVIFVDRSKTRLYELTNETFGATYAIKELTALTPEIGRPEIVRTAVQRKIDTRVHCVRSDGKVAVMIFDKLEEVNCWVLVETNGFIEDVVVLPAVGEEDRVYYLVKRTVDGATVRYLEKWALTSECEGGTLNKQADSFLHYSGAATQIITGMEHLEGEDVVVWADGVDLGAYTVTFSSVTLNTTVTEAIIGLGYSATFKSTKLAYAAQGGSALTQKKRIDHVGLILRNTHYQGLQYGDSFDMLDDLPLVEAGQVTAAGTIWDHYDYDSVEFNGTYDADSRLCLKASAPRPCTVLAAVLSMNTNEKL